jgi:hypothetical protein
MDHGPEITFTSEIENDGFNICNLLRAIRDCDMEVFLLQWQSVVFRPTDPFKMKWDVMIMLFSLFNCFSVPIKVSFNPESLNHISFNIANSFIDMFFFMDILISF